MWATRLPSQVWRGASSCSPFTRHLTSHHNLRLTHHLQYSNHARCFSSTPESPSTSSSTPTSASSSTPSTSSTSTSTFASSIPAFNTLNYIREQNLPLKRLDVDIMKQLNEEERTAYLYYLFVSNKKRANKVMSKPLPEGDREAINSLEQLKPEGERDEINVAEDPEEDMEEADGSDEPSYDRTNPAQLEAQQMEFIANYEINAHQYQLKKNRLLLMDQKEDSSAPPPTQPPSEFSNIDYDEFANFMQEVDNAFFETNFNMKSILAPIKDTGEDTLEQRRAIMRKRSWDEARVSREKHKLHSMLPVRFVVSQGRHVKVTPAGKRQSFSYLVLAGNGRGYGGYGHGKGPTLDVALRKAMQDVRRHLMFVPLHESRTIFNDLTAKCRQTKVLMMSTPRFSGIKGSRIIRAICEIFGITDITTKVIGRRHVKNTVFAFLNGLSQQTSIRNRAIIWGKNVHKMYEPGLYRPRMITESEIAEQAAVVNSIIHDLHKQHPKDPVLSPMTAIHQHTHLLTTLQDPQFDGIPSSKPKGGEGPAQGEGGAATPAQESSQTQEGGENKKKPKRDAFSNLTERRIKRAPFTYPEHVPTPLER